MNLFDLAAKITLDSSAYESGIKEAENTGKGFGEKIKSGLGTAAKVGGAAVVAIGTAAVATGKKLYSEVSDLAAYGDQIDKNSQKMGISAQAYQEWDFVLQHSGSSIDAMSRGMLTLSKQAESNSDAFEKLGISQKDLATLSKEDLFAKTIEGLQALGEGMERDALASELFGGSAKELGPLLNTSAAEVAAMKKQVNDLGGVMSNKAVKDAAKFQDSLTDMKTAFDGIKRNLTSQFLPSFSGVFKNLAGILTSSGKDAEKYQKGLAKNFGKISSDLIKQIPNIAQTAGKIGLALIDSLSEALTKNAGKFIRSGLNVIKELASDLISRIPDLMGSIGSIIGDVITNIPNIIELAWKIVTGLSKGILAGLPKIAAGIWKGIENLFNPPSLADTAMKDYLDDLHAKLDDIGISADEMYDKISGAETDAKTAEYYAKVFGDLHDKTNLTKEEQLLLNQAVEYLNGILPETSQIVQDESGYWHGNTEEIYANIEAMKARAVADAYLQQSQAILEQIATLQIGIDEKNRELLELKGKKDALTPKLENLRDAVSRAEASYDGLKESVTGVDGVYTNLDVSQWTDDMWALADAIGYNVTENTTWEQVVGEAMRQEEELQNTLNQTDADIDAHNAAVESMTNEMNGLSQQMDEAIRNASRWQEEAVKTGAAVTDGVASGILSRIEHVKMNAAMVMQAGIRAMQTAAVIKSPSHVARDKVGKMVGKGLELGLIDEVGAVEKASEKLSEAAMPDPLGTYDYKEPSFEKTSKPVQPIYLVLDTGELVGKTIDKFDRALGIKNAMLLKWEGA